MFIDANSRTWQGHLDEKHFQRDLGQEYNSQNLMHILHE